MGTVVLTLPISCSSKPLVFGEGYLKKIQVTFVLGKSFYCSVQNCWVMR